MKLDITFLIGAFLALAINCNAVIAAIPVAAGACSDLAANMAGTAAVQRAVGSANERLCLAPNHLGPAWPFPWPVLLDAHYLDHL